MFGRKNLKKQLLVAIESRNYADGQVGMLNKRNESLEFELITIRNERDRYLKLLDLKGMDIKYL